MTPGVQLLLSPERLFGRWEVLARPNPVPQRAGVYAWYFDEAPPGVDATGCHVHRDRALLYVGISPKAPPTNGAAPSRQTLRTRLRTHYGGNAAGSTLRLTLGCLLAERLGIQLRRVGSGGRYTFSNPGECVLDAWMGRHAFVTWIESPEPWLVEDQLIRSGLPLPLNIDRNPREDHRAVVVQRRARARTEADLLPVLADSGGARRQGSAPG